MINYDKLKDFSIAVSVSIFEWLFFGFLSEDELISLDYDTNRLKLIYLIIFNFYLINLVFFCEIWIFLFIMLIFFFVYNFYKVFFLVLYIYVKIMEC